MSVVLDMGRIQPAGTSLQPLLLKNVGEKEIGKKIDK